MDQKLRTDLMGGMMDSQSEVAIWIMVIVLKSGNWDGSIPGTTSYALVQGRPKFALG